MKKSILSLLLAFVAVVGYAQKPLTNSRQSSLYTYVYKLDDANTELFLNHRQDQLKDESLNDLTTKYLTDKPEKLNLPPGNYLKVTAVKNKLNYQLIQKHNVNLQLLDNGVNVRFVLLDNDGNLISNAQVYRNTRQIPFDQRAQA